MIMDEHFVQCADIKEVVALYVEKLKVNCQNIISGLDSIRWQKDPLLSYMMGLSKDIYP